MPATIWQPIQAQYLNSMLETRAKRTTKCWWVPHKPGAQNPEVPRFIFGYVIGEVSLHPPYTTRFSFTQYIGVNERYWEIGAPQFEKDVNFASIIDSKFHDQVFNMIQLQALNWASCLPLAARLYSYCKQGTPLIRYDTAHNRILRLDVPLTVESNNTGNVVCLDIRVIRNELIGMTSGLEVEGVELWIQANDILQL
jgi:hypothetical protein